MSFHPTNPNKNSFNQTSTTNHEDVDSLIPSIYSSQKKHITSTEWADKAVNWVKTKQSNEAMWNTFGISPAPKVTQVLSDVSTFIGFPNTVSAGGDVKDNGYSINEATGDYSNMNSATYTFLPATNSNVSPIASNISTDSESKRKLVPNWIKSVQTSKNIKTSKINQNSESANTHNASVSVGSRYVVCKKVLEQKINKLAQEISFRILLTTTTKFIEKICKDSIDDLKTSTEKLESSSCHRNRQSSVVGSEYSNSNKKSSRKKSKRRKSSSRSISSDHSDDIYKRSKSYSKHSSSRHSKKSSYKKRTKYSNRSSSSS